MKSNFFPYSSPFPILLFSVFLMVGKLPMLLSFNWYSTCSEQFTCGGWNVGFPFWGGGRTESCGHMQLELYCKGNTPTIDIMDVTYSVGGLNETDQTLRLERVDFFDGVCSTPRFGNTSFDSRVFEYAPGYGEGMILYDCSNSTIARTNVTCLDGTQRYLVRPTDFGFDGRSCGSRVTVGVFSNINSDDSDVWSLPKYGFQVKYKVDNEACTNCTRSKGVCGYDWNSNQTICYCPNQYAWQNRRTCPPTPSRTASLEPIPREKTGLLSLKLKWAIGIAAALFGIFAICFLMLWKCKRVALMKDKREEFDVEAFIRNSGSFAPKRYSYSSVKKMTSSFAEKIGKGGYGAVFKGKLPDGRLVAVKVLRDSKGNGEEFINEVACIGRTSHVNVVTLIGFCYERAKRALIYEFMPNGSLDKFIFNQGTSLNTNHRLDWRTLYDIAIGIARGLEYLHRGCNTRILHFDIKPHNILLDTNFCPKISDFGLSKLCKREESIVSMFGARGTIGYIAPEVVCRNVGGVSYKSDVYSYGMMVLEMVGGRKNVNAMAARSSEIYFPDWLRKHIEEDENLKLDETMSKEEEEITRKMIIVSLWCIQTIPSDRPSMTKVVEMLEGSLRYLQLPTKSLSSHTEEAEPSAQLSSSSSSSQELQNGDRT
ncbi:hypothetical protein UlMin_020891 [Ulmus minor]